jgi:hypothetical protein
MKYETLQDVAGYENLQPMFAPADKVKAIFKNHDLYVYYFKHSIRDTKVEETAYPSKDFGTVDGLYHNDIDTLSLSDLKRDYALIGAVSAPEDGKVTVSHLEAIFVAMQGENWSPEGEARELIRKSGASHTSMSVGDLIYNPMTREFYVVGGCGFGRMMQSPSDPEGMITAGA